MVLDNYFRLLENKSDLIIFASIWPLVWLMQKALVLFIERLCQRRQWLPDCSVVGRLLRAPLVSILSVACLHAFVPASNIPQNIKEVLLQLFSRAYIVTAVWLLIRAVSVIKRIGVYKFDFQSTDNLRARKIRTQFQFLERTANILILVIGFSMILMTFESVRRIGGSLIASAGVLGVVIGFAAQKTLGTFVSGFQIAFTQPIRIDDVVVVEKEWGQIEEITLTYVVIRIWDKRRLIVPINYFTEHHFENWTRTESNLLSYVFLNFDFTVNVDLLRAHFTELLKKSTLWDQKISTVQVTNASESTLQVRFLMGAYNSSQSFDLACYIREQMLAYVHATQPSALPRARAELLHGSPKA